MSERQPRFRKLAVQEIEEWASETPSNLEGEQLLGWDSARKRILEIGSNAQDVEEASDMLSSIIERTPGPRTDIDRGRLDAFQDALDALSGSEYGGVPQSVERPPTQTDEGDTPDKPMREFTDNNRSAGFSGASFWKSAGPYIDEGGYFRFESDGADGDFRFFIDPEGNVWSWGWETYEHPFVSEEEDEEEDDEGGAEVRHSFAATVIRNLGNHISEVPDHLVQKMIGSYYDHNLEGDIKDESYLALEGWIIGESGNESSEILIGDPTPAQIESLRKVLGGFYEGDRVDFEISENFYGSITPEEIEQILREREGFVGDDVDSTIASFWKSAEGESFTIEHFPSVVRPNESISITLTNGKPPHDTWFVKKGDDYWWWPNMIDEKTTLPHEIIDELREVFGERIFFNSSGEWESGFYIQNSTGVVYGLFNPPSIDPDGDVIRGIVEDFPDVTSISWRGTRVAVEDYLSGNFNFIFVISPDGQVARKDYGSQGSNFHADLAREVGADGSENEYTDDGYGYVRGVVEGDVFMAIPGVMASFSDAQKQQIAQILSDIDLSRFNTFLIEDENGEYDPEDLMVTTTASKRSEVPTLEEQQRRMDEWLEMIEEENRAILSYSNPDVHPTPEEGDTKFVVDLRNGQGYFTPNRVEHSDVLNAILDVEEGNVGSNPEAGDAAVAGYIREDYIEIFGDWDAESPENIQKVTRFWSPKEKAFVWNGEAVFPDGTYKNPNRRQADFWDEAEEIDQPAEETIDSPANGNDLLSELEQFGITQEPPSDPSNVVVFGGNRFYWPSNDPNLQEETQEVTGATDIGHADVVDLIMEYHPDANEDEIQVGYYINGGHELYDTHGNFLGEQEEEDFGTREMSRSPEEIQSILDQNAGEDLEGLPSKVNIPNVGRVEFHSNREIQETARNYRDATGTGDEHPTEYVKVKPEVSQRIAQEYDEMEHNPHDPEVQRAYDALIKETLAQYEALRGAGYVLEFYPEGEDPYPNSPREAVLDIHQNKHMYVYPTDDGFGSEDDEYPDNPLLQDTGIRWRGRPVLANDLFRGVHDAYGHALTGVGFRADGEDNAFRQHASMFSPEARRALASETRGQNSWVNFGPYGESNQTASAEDTVFASQKIGLMPEWVSDPNLHKKMVETKMANSRDYFYFDDQEDDIGVDSFRKRLQKSKRADFWDEADDLDPYDMEGELDKEFSIQIDDLESSGIHPTPLYTKVNKFIYYQGSTYYWDAYSELDIDHDVMRQILGIDVFGDTEGLFFGVFSYDEDPLVTRAEVPEIMSDDSGLPKWVIEELERAFNSSTIIFNGDHISLPKKVEAEVVEFPRGVMADDSMESEYGVMKDQPTSGGYNKFIVADWQMYCWVVDPNTLKPFHMHINKKIRSQNPSAKIQMTGFWSDVQDLYQIEGSRGNFIVKVHPDQDVDECAHWLRENVPDVPKAFFAGVGWIDLSTGDTGEADEDEVEIEMSSTPVEGVSNSLIVNDTDIIFWPDDGRMTHPEAIATLYGSVENAIGDSTLAWGSFLNGRVDLDGEEDVLNPSTLELVQSTLSVQSITYRDQPVGQPAGEQFELHQ